jgi:hypothetical protein
MAEHLKLVTSAPSRRTMILELEIGHDHLRIGSGKLIPRPVHISRDRWLAFWKYIATHGLTPETLAEGARFVGVRPFPGTDLRSRRKRGKQTPPKP